MIRLKKKQEEKKAEEAAEAAAAKEAGANAPVAAESKDGDTGGSVKIFGLGRGKKAKKNNVKKKTPGEIRIQKDIADLDGGDVAKIDFPDPNDLTNFLVTVSPSDGYWKGARYKFTIKIPAMYPHEAPKVHCDTQIYHPNIDTQGNVCLNILREDWKPVLDINAVIYGLIYLFYDPNPDDPLNREAAELFRNDISQFTRIVQRTLRGGHVQGQQYERFI